MKKLLIFTVVAVLSMFALACNSVAAVDSTQYQENISLLSGLGAQYAENKMDNGEGGMMRGEFVKILINLTLEQDDAIMSGVFYSDVDRSHLAFNEINSALAMGVISSDESRTFRPNEQITYNEAIKTIVSILGYKEMAKSLGDYPDGYLNVAAQIGLLKGVSLVSDGLSNETAIGLLINMLDANICEALSDSKVAISRDKTFLSYYRNIYTNQGMLTANDLTGFYDNNNTRRGMVVINNTGYYTGDTDISEYLGFQLKVYANHNPGDNEGIIVHYVKLSTNQVREITTQDSPYAYGNSIFYNDQEVRINPNASVILNGVFRGNVRALDLDEMLPTTGWIKTLSHGGGAADALFIESYMVYVAEAVSVGGSIIYDKYNNPPLRLEDADQYSIKAYGEDTYYELDYISEWNVLMVRVQETSKDKRIEITIVDSPIKGVLTEIYNNGNKTTYAIDGTEYEISEHLLNNQDELPKLGERSVFYVDFTGKIVAINHDVKANYGYLIALGKTDGLDNKIQLKMYTHTGKFVVYDCNNTVLLDNQPYTSEEFYNNMMPFKDQLVKYDFNGKGQLTSLERAVDLAQNIDYVGYNEDVFSIDGVLEMESYIFRNYIRQGSTLNVTYGVSGATVFFDIPADLNAEKRYSVATQGRYTAEGCIPLGTRVYDVDIAGKASVVLIKRAEASVLRIVEGDKTGLFKKLVSSIDDEGTPCDGIYFYNRGEATILSSSGVDYDNSSDYGYGIVPIEDLRDGDFMQYSVDTTGKIVSYRVIFRPSEPDLFTTRGSLWSGITSYYGQVVKAEGSRNMRYFSMMLNGKLFPFLYDYTQAKNYNADGAYVYIYNSSKNRERVDLGTGAEIMDGDRVFVKMYYGIGQIMIIVRE